MGLTAVSRSIAGFAKETAWLGTWGRAEGSCCSELGSCIEFALAAPLCMLRSLSHSASGDFEGLGGLVLLSRSGQLRSFDSGPGTWVGLQKLNVLAQVVGA